MNDHECYIGVLYRMDNNDLITLDELKEYLEEEKAYDKKIYEMYGIEFRPLYTLKDYADGRKGHNLTKFNYCPYCGKRIDWKKIKSKGEE